MTTEERVLSRLPDHVKILGCGVCGVPLLSQEYASLCIRFSMGIVARRVAVGVRRIPYCGECWKTKLKGDK